MRQTKPATNQRKRKLAGINTRIRAAQKRLRGLEAERDAEWGRTFVRCTRSVLGQGCGRMTQVRKLIYIQTHWYVSPHGCTEGDYWKEGEGQFDCPKCGNRNQLYDRPEIEEMKWRFKRIEDTFDK